MEKNIIKNIFFENNKNGHKTRESYIKKNLNNIYIDLLKFQTKYSLSGVTFKELIYLYINDITSIPRCLYCNKQLKFKKSISEGYGTYCSVSCANKSQSHINKAKLTNFERYGGISPMSSQEIKNKIKKTNLKKYGVGNYFQKTRTIQKIINEKYGDPIITRTEHYKKIMNKKYEEKYSEYNIKKENEEIFYTCPTCNEISVHNFNSFNYRVKNNINLCKKCIPPYQSMIEEELENLLIELNINFQRHARTIIPPKELDFYIPDLKLAIEMNGLYYHSDIFIDDIYYHFKKWNDCQKNNITLLQIWEDEWKYKKQIIENIIKNKTGVESIKVYARKCEIKIITAPVYKYFVEEYHIQGYSPAKIKLGLFYNNELIQIMSFSGNRKFMGSQKSPDCYEIIRLCTKTNFIVIGGSEKLLSYFEKLANPKKIISYCDIRLFNGNTYEKMGFTLAKITKPNYFYIKQNDIKRYHRFNFRKDRLVGMGFDINQTEKNIMKELGYSRVYDCGNKKFIKIYT